MIIYLTTVHMEHHFSHYVGDDLNLPVYITDSDGTAFNITGYTVYFTVKRRTDTESDDSDAVITADVTSHTDPTSGQTLILVSHSITEEIEPGVYNYDIQMKSGEDIVTTVLSGKVTFTKDTTKRS